MTDPADPWVHVDQIAGPVELFLASVGTVGRTWREQDSGCISLRVDSGPRSWFVKYASTTEAATSLLGATRFHRSVGHPAIIPLVHSFRAASGPVLVYPWVDGEVLYDPVAAPGEEGRGAPESAHLRFRSMPPNRIIAALTTIIEAHVAVVAAGYVAGDFYDGCVIYDFGAHRVWLCDLDEYRPGPFVLSVQRLPGSTRFMAPEESTAGATTDQRTTVFNLGRAIQELVGNAANSSIAEVAAAATATKPERRHPTVGALAAAWRDAVA